MENSKDLLIESFIIFIKDDGKLTDKDILNGLGYPNHQLIKEDEYPMDNHLRIGRYGDWIYILDVFYQNWHRNETWKFIARTAKTYDIVHCMMEDVDDGGMFGYHKDGKLVRLFDYKQENSLEMETTISKGKPLKNENEILKDKHFWFMKLAMTLGIDIKKSNKNFLLYDDSTLNEIEYSRKYSAYNQEDSDDLNQYTAYNYYLK